MYAQVEKPKENKSRAVANSVAQKQSCGESTYQLVDNRPAAIAQRKLKGMVNNSNHSVIVQLNRIVQLKEKDALELASNLHPMKKSFVSITQLTESKLDFSKASWESIVSAYNSELEVGQPRLRAVYPEVEAEVTKKESTKGRITGFGSDGKPFSLTTMQKVGEKLQAAIRTAIHHAPDLASTGLEMATHTVDGKALYTASSEFIKALKESGGDLSAGDYKSLAVHLADAAAGAVRSGASVASVTHRVSQSLEMVGVGIPGIGLLVKLTGDGMWYSAEYARNKFHQVMDPRILKDPTHKKRINKMD
jgi:hypothetical protein